MSDITAVITIARGRHDHLRGLIWGLRRQHRPPTILVVVGMGDPELAAVARELPDSPWRLLTAEIDLTDAGLPLAAARNLGAQRAAAAGAQRLIFLDVDCIPSDRLVGRYNEAIALCSVRRRAHPGPTVVSGEVSYLPPITDPALYRRANIGSTARPHPGRPALPSDEMWPADDLRLFWSLSFGIDVSSWNALGGFDEEYVGYGGEDTDFAQRLGAADGRLVWIGGAPAYHQHHHSLTPPTQHLEAIVANANRFHQRWGWFPMEGWLRNFDELGLAEYDQRSARWSVR